MVTALFAVGVLAAGTAAPASYAAPPPEQRAQIWAHFCAAAGGEVFSNPGPLDCVALIPEPFTDSGLAQLRRLCEHTFHGEFLVRVVTTAHAYCFVE